MSRLFNRRLLIALSAAGLVLPVVAIAFAEDPANLVRIDNFTFSPTPITVPVGTTVTWRNDDDIPHTVFSPAAKIRSKALDTGDSYTFTFNEAGEYPYICSLHPHMMGKVIVTK